MAEKTYGRLSKKPLSAADSLLTVLPSVPTKKVPIPDHVIEDVEERPKKTKKKVGVSSELKKPMIAKKESEMVPDPSTEVSTKKKFTSFKERREAELQSDGTVVCATCGGPHREQTCLKKNCLRCRQPGHLAKNCPESRPSDDGICYSCGQTGHVLTILTH